LIIDTSAIVAILRAEPDALKFAKAIEDAATRRVSAVSFVEAAAVIDGSRSPVSSRRLDDFFREAQIEIESVSEEQARIARDAYRDFGRGSGHRAGLNLGDCFTYALAKVMSEPILYKGRDFVHTDVPSAI
jgi:ribonuclease VapC